jgi:hypothetical protein
MIPEILHFQPCLPQPPRFPALCIAFGRPIVLRREGSMEYRVPQIGHLFQVMVNIDHGDWVRQNFHTCSITGTINRSSKCIPASSLGIGAWSSTDLDGSALPANVGWIASKPHTPCCGPYQGRLAAHGEIWVTWEILTTPRAWHRQLSKIISMMR